MILWDRVIKRKNLNQKSKSGLLMPHQAIKIIKSSFSLTLILAFLFLPQRAASDAQRATAGNFGLPGVIDLPSAKRFPDGELIIRKNIDVNASKTVKLEKQIEALLKENDVDNVAALMKVLKKQIDNEK